MYPRSLPYLTALKFFLQIEESNVQSWRKGCRQVDETKQKGLFMGCFTANFLQDFTRIKI